MDTLRKTLDLAEAAQIAEEDIKAIGLSWRWYLKVRTGGISNPGIKNVDALREVAEKKLAARRGHAA